MRHDRRVGGIKYGSRNGTRRASPRFYRRCCAAQSWLHVGAAICHLGVHRLHALEFDLIVPPFDDWIIEPHHKRQHTANEKEWKVDVIRLPTCNGDRAERE